MKAYTRVLPLIAVAVTLSACADGQNIFARDQAPRRTAYTAPAVQYSANVHNAQKRLQRLGFYQGKLDGLWGPETRRAVERFQRQEGLLVTAQLDGRTTEALNDEPLPRRTTATPQVLESPGFVVSDADDIRAIQARLRELGFYDGAADGIWGPGTQAALERFQRTRALPPGEVTSDTIIAMHLNLDDFYPQRAFGEVQGGDRLSPEMVRSMQRRLREMGFYFGPIDGEWGASTHTALKQFQRARGIEPTGDLTPATASVMGLDPKDLRTSAARD